MASVATLALLAVCALPIHGTIVGGVVFLAFARFMQSGGWTNGGCCDKLSIKNCKESGNMLVNTKLKNLMDSISNQDYNGCILSLEPVERRYTLSGDDYYCIKENFCFQQSKDFVAKIIGFELSNYEWDGNEIFVSEQSVEQVINKAIKIVTQLKKYLHINFPQIAFDIFLSVDIEDADLPPSATIRFYKVREDYHIVTVEKMDDYPQPVGICQLCGKTEDVPLSV